MKRTNFDAFFVFICVKKFVIIILLILFALLNYSCATKRKANEYNDLRGLMLLENTQLGRNKHFNSPKYQRMLKNNYKKITKKR